GPRGLCNPVRRARRKGRHEPNTTPERTVDLLARSARRPARARRRRRCGLRWKQQLEVSRQRLPELGVDDDHLEHFWVDDRVDDDEVGLGLTDQLRASLPTGYTSVATAGVAEEHRRLT